MSSLRWQIGQLGSKWKEKVRYLETVDKSSQCQLFCFVCRRVNRSYFRVVAGLHVLSPPGNQAQFRSIHYIIMHKGYDDVMFENDVTLLLLSSPFNFTDHVQPVCTPHNVTHESHLNFSHCFITGWGSKYYKGWYKN